MPLPILVCRSLMSQNRRILLNDCLLAVLDTNTFGVRGRLVALKVIVVAASRFVLINA